MCLAVNLLTSFSPLLIALVAVIVSASVIYDSSSMFSVLSTVLVYRVREPFFSLSAFEMSSQMSSSIMVGVQVDVVVFVERLRQARHIRGITDDFAVRYDQGQHRELVLGVLVVEIPDPSSFSSV
eukprot:16092166-Heterocapsa_arctica.AAC.1